MTNNYLDNLNSKSVWAFTKQTTDYEMAFNATKLFANYCENEDTTTENIEDIIIVATIKIIVNTRTRA